MAIKTLDAMVVRDRKDLAAHRAHAEISTRKLTFGALAFSYPEDHYNLLIMIYPDMVSLDAEEKRLFFTKKAPYLRQFQPYKINPDQQFNKKRVLQ